MVPGPEEGRPVADLKKPAYPYDVLSDILAQFEEGLPVSPSLRNVAGVSGALDYMRSLGGNPGVGIPGDVPWDAADVDVDVETVQSVHEDVFVDAVASSPVFSPENAAESVTEHIQKLRDENLALRIGLSGARFELTRRAGTISALRDQMNALEEDMDDLIRRIEEVLGTRAS